MTDHADALAKLQGASKTQFDKARERGRLPQTGGRTIWVKEEEWTAFQRALTRARQIESKPSLREGEAVELMAAEFLATYGEPGDEF